MLNVATARTLRELDQARWEALTPEEVTKQVFLCALSPSYFINTFIYIFDAEATSWIHFDLWPEQEDLLAMVLENQQTITLKPRQIGITWLALSIIIWLCLFRPKQVCLIFSKRDDEAMQLLSDERLRGMLTNLPSWLRPTIVEDNAHRLRFSNGSIIIAFGPNGGDSYTATFVFIDEGDLIPDLARLMRAAEPTMLAGGKMFLISKVDKGKPNSYFKKIYEGAKKGVNGWAYMFLAWWVHPARTQAWYEAEREKTYFNTGSYDDLHENYPATDVEALGSRTLGKRFAPIWVTQCYVETYFYDEGPAIPGLRIYRLPEPGRKYAQGCDPAEGNPTSDDSALTVIDALTLEEVASLYGKFEPEAFGSYIDQVGTFFNKAPALVERNNHGHAVLLWLKLNSKLRRLKGRDHKEGWLTNAPSKALLYDTGASTFKKKETVIHTDETVVQIKSIDGSTLSAPEGEKDDLSVSYMLALTAAPETMKYDDTEMRIW